MSWFNPYIKTILIFTYDSKKKKNLHTYINI